MDFHRLQWAPSASATSAVAAAPRSGAMRRRITVDLGEPGQPGEEVGLGEDSAPLGPVEEVDVLLIRRQPATSHRLAR